MSSKFGSSVMLGDLDDFIGPSQACVNPILPTAGAERAASGGATISLDSGISAGM